MCLTQTVERIKFCLEEDYFHPIRSIQDAIFLAGELWFAYALITKSLADNLDDGYDIRP